MTPTEALARALAAHDQRNQDRHESNVLMTVRADWVRALLEQAAEALPSDGSPAAADPVGRLPRAGERIGDSYRVKSVRWIGHPDLVTDPEVEVRIVLTRYPDEFLDDQEMARAYLASVDEGGER